VDHRNPEAPCARLATFRAIMSLVAAGSIGSPTPAAWERTMLRWSASSPARSIRTLASFPKPVLIP
jgi:hypothetical protein